MDVVDGSELKLTRGGPVTPTWDAWTMHGAAARLLADEIACAEAWWVAARSGQCAYPAVVWADGSTAAPHTASHPTEPR